MSFHKNVFTHILKTPTSMTYIYIYAYYARNIKLCLLLMFIVLSIPDL